MPGGSKKGGGLETKKSTFYKMKGHTLPGPHQRRGNVSGDPTMAPADEALEDTLYMSETEDAPIMHKPVPSHKHPHQKTQEEKSAEGKAKKKKKMKKSKYPGMTLEGRL